MESLMMKPETREQVADRIASVSPDLPRTAPRQRFELPIARFGRTGRYAWIELETPEKLREAHRHDAQYVTLVLGENEPRFFVLANRPGTNWVFLIDPTEAIAPLLEELEPGSTIEASLPEGAGYPNADDFDRLLIFATGSGIASVRSVLQRLDDSEDAPETWLFYGEELARDFAYLEELRDFEARSVTRLAMVSGGTFVQQAFDESGVDPRGAAVFLCGAPVMVHAVTFELLERGVDESCFHTNV